MLAEVAAVSEPSEAWSVYVPAAETERSLNVATPFTASTVSVPLRLPEPVEPAPMASVTLELSLATTLPLASSTSTVTDGAIVLPAIVLLGCWPKASCVA